MCCCPACSRVAQGHAGSTGCLSEMNADLLPLEKVVTGHGGTGKWTRKKAFGFSRCVRSRREAAPVVTINELVCRAELPPAGTVVDLLCVVGGFGFSDNSGPDSFWIWGGGNDWMDCREEAFGCVDLTGTAPWVTELLELSNADIYDDWPLEPDKVVMVRNARFVGFENVYGKLHAQLLACAADVDTDPQHPWATTLKSWVRFKQSKAKKAKAKKERWAKRKAAATRIQARSVSEGSLAAALLNGSAGQLVVGSTILGRSIANDEPLYGGKCACVGLLTGDVPPCLGGSVTVFDDAPEAFYYAAWDYCERYIDQACDVRFFDLTGSEGIFTDITSLRQLLSVGDPFDLPGNPDLQTFLAERREPLGYTNTGRRLVHSQDLVFMVVAAVFMQIDVVLLDAASACPLYMIVRCRLDPRRACAPSH